MLNLLKQINEKFQKIVFFLLLSVVLIGYSNQVVALDLDVQCSFSVIPEEPSTNLSGFFIYQTSANSQEAFEHNSIIQVLDQTGTLIDELPLESGDIVELKIQKEILIQGDKNGSRWTIFAPGVLARAEIKTDYESKFAYASPFAAVRIDQPIDRVFSASPLAPEAPVHLIAGISQMKSGSIELLIDCVDILQATGAILPGGPFSGNVEIAGKEVKIDNLVGDFDKGYISFSLYGLPGGSHLVNISGTSVTSDIIAPSVQEHQLLKGVSVNEAEFMVFRPEIVSPTKLSNLPLGDVEITGTISHGKPLNTLRVHGRNIELTASQITQGSDCVGDLYQYSFSTLLPLADLKRDIESGDDKEYTVDPGANYVSIIATDSDGNSAGDRTYFTVGNVEEPVNLIFKEGDECEPVPSIPGYVKNGFVISLSEKVLNERIKSLMQESLRSTLKNRMQNFVGNSIKLPLKESISFLENPEFQYTDVDYDSSNLELDARIVGDSIQIRIKTGSLVVKMKCRNECIWRGLLGNCLTKLSTRVIVNIGNITSIVSINSNQLYCGLDSTSKLSSTIKVDDLNIELRNYRINGHIFSNHKTTIRSAFYSWVANKFSGTIAASFENSLKSKFEEGSGFTFTGLNEVSFDNQLPEGIPLSMSVKSSNTPRLTDRTAITIPLHTDFDPVSQVSPEPPWFPTQSGFPGAGGTNSDMMISISDDMLNQMLSALTSTGVLRQQYSGLTLSDVIGQIEPNTLDRLAPLGIDSDTPILITLDQSQDQDGNSIPPIFAITDDPNTPEIEMIIRVQFLLRLILERDQSVDNDRELCGCTELGLECIGKPCVIQESVLKLNLLTHCTLGGSLPNDPKLIFVVDEIQQLDRSGGSSAFEITSLEAEEDEIVESSENSPTLAMLQDALNTNLPPISIPYDAFTLGGTIVPTNIRLFSITKSDAGLGDQDYFGLLADIILDTLFSNYTNNDSEVTWIAGDADSDGTTSITDVVHLISYIFESGEVPNPLESGDADCSGAIDISDAVHILAYIFGNGSAPCDGSL